MCEVTKNELNNWGNILNNSDVPLVERFRALWGLKHAKEDLAIDLIAMAFNSKSELLKHELAYCLGQKKNTYAINALIVVLEDESQEPIVRHEAGEALAAIGDIKLLDIMRKHSSSSIVELAETCHLGLKRLEFIRDNDLTNIPLNEFDTVDPAPEFPISEKDIDELELILSNKNEDIFNRYRALFSLRRIANSIAELNERALQIICRSLTCPSSALFRHEIAFVLGQLAKPNSRPALEDSVADVTEYGMVRHESAEALGAIGNNESQEFLKKYLSDPVQVVAESCIVALDIAEYNNSETFEQYALIPDTMKQ